MRENNHDVNADRIFPWDIHDSPDDSKAKTPDGRKLYIPVKWVNERFEDAMKRGYVVSTKGQYTRRLVQTWYEWCEWWKWPHVSVVQSRKYAEVELELLPLPWQLERGAECALRACIESIIGQPVRWRSVTNGGCIYAQSIPLESAADVAEVMFEYGLRARDRAQKHYENERRPHLLPNQPDELVGKESS